MEPKIKVKSEENLTPELIRELIKSVISTMGPQYTAEEKKEHAKLLLKIFEKGMDPYQALKLSQEDIGYLYLVAYRLFNAGKYKEACEAFKMLTFLVPSNAGYYTSLGVCYHKMNQHEAATKCYLGASCADLTDPVPLFYCYDCYLNMKDIISAGIVLSNAVARCGDNPRYAKLKGRASLLLEGIKKEITEKHAPQKAE